MCFEFRKFPQFIHKRYPFSKTSAAPVSWCQFFWQWCGSANVGRDPRSDEFWRWSPHHPTGLGSATPPRQLWTSFLGKVFPAKHIKSNMDMDNLNRNHKCFFWAETLFAKRTCHGHDSSCLSGGPEGIRSKEDQSRSWDILDASGWNAMRITHPNWKVWGWWVMLL